MPMVPSTVSQKENRQLNPPPQNLVQGNLYFQQVTIWVAHRFIWGMSAFKSEIINFPAVINPVGRIVLLFRINNIKKSFYLNLNQYRQCKTI